MTSREKQNLQLFAEGRLNREIAAMPDIRFRTVKNHRAKVIKKLNLSRTADLVRYAIQPGMTDVTL